MTDITIPKEALEAAAFHLPGYHSRDLWSHVEAACLAMLKAWPGMEHDPGALVAETYRDPGKIILPLPQGASDE